MAGSVTLRGDRVRRSLVVYLLLTTVALVTPLASAASQRWYLNIDDPEGFEEYGNCSHSAPIGYCEMSTTAGTATTREVNSARHWVASEPAASNVQFAKQAWALRIQVTSAQTGSFVTRLGQVEPDGDFVEAASFSTTLFSGNNPLVLSLSPSTDFTVLAGNSLALRFETNNPGTQHVGTGTASTVDSPSGDPGYPTPEVASFVLAALGLAVLGVLAFRKRKQR